MKEGSGSGQKPPGDERSCPSLVQKKLGDHDFFSDLDASIAHLVRDLLLGRDVARLAAGLGKTDSLLYKWANPHDPQRPSLKQFLQLVKLTQNCQPVEDICRACGLITVGRGPVAAMLRELADAWEEA